MIASSQMVCKFLSNYIFEVFLPHNYWFFFPSLPVKLFVQILGNFSIFLVSFDRSYFILFTFVYFLWKNSSKILICFVPTSSFDLDLKICIAKYCPFNSEINLYVFTYLKVSCFFSVFLPFLFILSWLSKSKIIGILHTHM